MTITNDTRCSLILLREMEQESLTLKLFKVRKTDKCFTFGYKVSGPDELMHEYVRWVQEQPWSKKWYNYQEPQYWTLFPHTTKTEIKLFKGGKYGWYQEGYWKHFDTKTRALIHLEFIKKVANVYYKKYAKHLAEHVT